MRSIRSARLLCAALPRHFGIAGPDPGLDATDCITRGLRGQRGAVGATVNLRSPAVAQTGGDTVDAKMYGLHDALVALATAMALEQLNLDVMQRVDIRKPVAY